jgi:hypothetical protein
MTPTIIITTKKVETIEKVETTVTIKKKRDPEHDLPQNFPYKKTDQWEA